MSYCINSIIQRESLLQGVEERKRQGGLAIHESLLDGNGSANDEQRRLTVTRRPQPARSSRHRWGVAGFYSPNDDALLVIRTAAGHHTCAAPTSLVLPAVNRALALLVPWGEVL